jgi:hypothetical protein
MSAYEEAELLRIAMHEAGHTLARWFYRDEIVAVTLNNYEGGGAVFARGYSNNVIGARQQMVVYAAGAAAEGTEVKDTDAAWLRETAGRIAGLNGSPETLQQEIRRAEVGAAWLVTEYAGEIVRVAEALLSFHELLAGFERRHRESILD